MDLIADIGATNSRCALIDPAGQTAKSDTFHNAGFAGLAPLLAKFIEGVRVERAALAVAGPITDSEIRLLNIDWRFDSRKLEQSLGLDALIVLNDFEALAHSLPHLGAGDCHAVGNGRALSGRAMAVIGPGSGLGVAAAVPDGSGFVAVAGEGGHVSLPAFDATEAAVIRDYADANGHCSAERLLSGPGLERIHRSLSRKAGSRPEALSAAEITARAAKRDELAVSTYELFFSLLGTVAGNLALTVGARGGVFVGGGIVPRVVEAFERSAFRERFVARGRYRDYLDAIPTAVITTATPAFIGLRKVLGHV